MNSYIIVGIMIFASGAGLIGFSISIIAGILLNAVGTGMIVYGQYVKSKNDTSEMSRVLQDKVDNVLKRIDEVQEGEKDEASAGKIGQIEQEFKDWAVEFLKNREMKKVELARSELDSLDNQLKASNELKPIYEYVLKTIESLAQAYNAESGETTEVDFPPLPSNLYSEEARDYGGKVVFPNNFVWRIQFLTSKPPKRENPPTMYINFEITGERDHGNSYLSIGDLDQKRFRINITGHRVPTAEGIEGTFPFNSYQDSLKPIMCRLFEAQLLRD